MTFGQAYAASWRGSLAFLAACPLLALVPVALELLQHIVEVQRGMFDSLAAAKAADSDPIRLAFGLVKVVGLVLPGYWVARFLAWRDPARARQADPVAIRRFAPVVAYQVALAAVELLAMPRTGSWLLVQFVLGEIVGALLLAWAVAAALGDAMTGPAASARLMAPRLVSTILLTLAAILPLMVPHYALGALAIVGPAPLRWPVLVADSLLVGWLAALMTAAGFFAVRRVAERTRAVPALADS